MKNLIILLIGTLSFISCDQISGNGSVVQEKREISAINAVRSSGSIDVDIVTGDAYSVTVEDDQNLISYIVTDVRDGVLNIHYKENSSVNNSHAKVTVTAPTLSKIITSGSGNIEGSGTIKNDSKLELELSGSGNVNLDVDAPSVKVSASGSGDIKLSGKTKNFDCKAGGSGNVDCAGLQSEDTNIDISGSGNAYVFASVHLVASTRGSGDIFYSGNPSSPEIHTSGSGEVHKQ